ncbi:hypothetical protein D3C76_1622320 [compost metagenome]
MVGAGQQHFGAKRLAGLDDTGIVGGDDYTAGSTFTCLFPHVLDHRLAGDH